MDRPDPGLAARSARWSITPPTCCSARSDGGQTWDADQPRPDAQRQEQAEMVRRPDHRRQHRRRGLRHHLRHRRVAARRRACSGPAATTAWSTSSRDGGKTWTNVTKNIPGMPEWGTVACIEPSPLRRRHRLRRRRCPPPGRRSALPLQDDRLRQDLEEPGGQVAADTLSCTPSAKTRSARACSTSAPSAASRISGNDGKSWQELQLNLPTVAGPRPGGQGQRPGGRHPRPIGLDLRRPDAGARILLVDGRARFLLVVHGAGRPLALPFAGLFHQRKDRRGKSAQGRHHRLFSEAEAKDGDQAGGAGRQG